MINENLSTAMMDLVDGIRGVCLGSIEQVVIEAACKELILNWNDHNHDDPIDEQAELKELDDDINNSHVTITTSK